MKTLAVQLCTSHYLSILDCKHLNSGCLVNQIKFLHNGSQVVFTTLSYWKANMTRYNPRRSQQEWLWLITDCRQSNMTDNAWCAQHHIPLNSFYNAVIRLRKKASAIPESTAPSDNSYTLDFTSHQDVISIGIGPVSVAAEAHIIASILILCIQCLLPKEDACTVTFIRNREPYLSTYLRG